MENAIYRPEEEREAPERKKMQELWQEDLV